MYCPRSGGHRFEHRSSRTWAAQHFFLSSTWTKNILLLYESIKVCMFKKRHSKVRYLLLVYILMSNSNTCTVGVSCARYSARYGNRHEIFGYAAVFLFCSLPSGNPFDAVTFVYSFGAFTFSQNSHCQQITMRAQDARLMQTRVTVQSVCMCYTAITITEDE